LHDPGFDRIEVLARESQDLIAWSFASSTQPKQAGNLGQREPEAL
jgi:hypothetical protein